MMIAVLLVILVLAAQYESWSLPMAIVLIVPMCVLAALFGVWISHFPPFAQPGDLNIFTQVALVVLVGLACKNAILIVEFAKELEERGEALLDAVIKACRMRLRPILMTSIAFCAGVLPLIFGSGAGSEMRRAMGIAVFSGMLGVTLFGIFLTPVFYVLLRGRQGAAPAGAGRRRGGRAATGRDGAPVRGAAGRRPCVSRASHPGVRLVAAAIAILAVAGCTVGPNYQAPAVPLDPAFVNAARRPAPRRPAPTSPPSGAASATRGCRCWSSTRSPPTATSASPRRGCRRRGRRCRAPTPSGCPRSASPPPPAAR